MPALPDPKALGELDLFRGLSPTELARVNDRLGQTKFAAGATVLTATQPGEAAYVVLSGTLKVSTLQSNGRELTLAVLGPGEVVGELAVADRAGRSADVVALEPSMLLWIDRGSFDQLRRDIPAISDNLIRLLARRLRLANAQLQAMATLDVHGRVARQLLALADALGEETAAGVRIPVRLTQSELASLIGATRVRVNEVLVSFKRRRLLAIDAQHRITIRDRAELEAYLE
jgi:CRP/FNR family transcriptional regulator, cyclic AMP receptor protein